VKDPSGGMDAAAVDDEPKRATPDCPPAFHFFKGSVWRPKFGPEYLVTSALDRE